jgi:hypothetical protein
VGFDTWIGEDFIGMDRRKVLTGPMFFFFWTDGKVRRSCLLEISLWSHNVFFFGREARGVMNDTTHACTGQD